MLIQRNTPVERRANEQALNQVLFAFCDLNASGFTYVLSDNGQFLGMSKMQFLGKLNSLFLSIKSRGVKSFCINYGICIDKLPGCEVMEVRYAFSEDLLSENGMYEAKAYAEKDKNEEIIRFAFQLDNGRVKRIVKTGRFLERSQEDEQSEFNFN